MRIVAALGGNALLRRGEALSAANQASNVKLAAISLAPLVEAGHQVVITHGNGPQVGLLALQAAAGPADGDQPLDVLDAQSEGMIGYLIEREMRNLLGPTRRVATLLTQVRVDPRDPAFDHPTKPIGPVCDDAGAARLSAKGFAIARDGTGWRRVVASPAPAEILVAPIVADLVDAGVLVICAGGGGIPVVRDEAGHLQGIEAVIDKDLASGVLARSLRADLLLMLTDVEAVMLDWRQPEARAIAEASPQALAALDFAAGSMGPKVAAAIAFAQGGQGRAVIGRLQDAVAMVAGHAGTGIREGATGITCRLPS